MEDEGSSNGISGWAGYALGRMAAESDVARADWIRRVSARLRGEVPVDVGSLQNEIWRLRSIAANKDKHIAELNEHIQGMERNYDRLNEWSVWAEQRIVELKGKLRDHGIS